MVGVPLRSGKRGPITEPGMAIQAGAPDGTAAGPGEGFVAAGWVMVLIASTLGFIWWIVMWSPMGLARQYNFLIGGDAMKIAVNLVFSGFTGFPAVLGAIFVPLGMWINWRTKRAARWA